MTIETKQLCRPFEVKSITEKGEFTGYASVFGVKDSYGDVVVKGAFARSLGDWKKKDQLPALLWQHDARSPVGVWTKMAEDDHGLFAEGRLALKTQQGAEAYELLKMGAIRGLSIGFSVASGGVEIDKATGATLLKQITLWETSLVTFPANSEATVDRVKSVLSSPKALEQFLREAGLPRSVAKALVAGGYARTSDLREADTRLPELITALRGLRG